MKTWMVFFNRTDGRKECWINIYFKIHLMEKQRNATKSFCGSKFQVFDHIVCAIKKKWNDWWLKRIFSIYNQIYSTNVKFAHFFLFKSRLFKYKVKVSSKSENTIKVFRWDSGKCSVYAIFSGPVTKLDTSS